MTTNERIEQLERELQELKQELQKQVEEPKLRILYETETTLEMQYGEYVLRNDKSIADNYFDWFKNGENIDDVVRSTKILELYQSIKQRQKEEGMEVLYSDDFLTVVVCEGERYLRFWSEFKNDYFWVKQLPLKDEWFINTKQTYLEQKYQRITE
jgi:hypothetical protein